MVDIIQFLKNYGADEGMGSFESYLTSIEDEIERERILAYDEYYDYFYGNIVKIANAIEGERPSSNLISNFVYKLNGWLLQEEPIIKSKNVVHSIIDELISELFENSSKSIITDILVNSSLYGDCFVKVFIDLKEMQVFKDKAEEKLFTFGFRIIDNPRYCFVTYDILDNIKEFIVVYPNFVVDDVNVLGNINSEKIDRRYPLYFEVWTDKIVYCSYNFLIDEKKYFDFVKNKKEFAINGVLNDVKESRYYNLYMFDNIYGQIPFVHFRNLNFFKKSYGVSDVRALMTLAREKTSVINAIKDIIDYQSNPPLVVKGAVFNDIVGADKKIFSNVPKDSDLYYLDLKIGDLDRVINIYEEMLDNEISSCGLPYDFLVSSRDFIGGDSSASALKLKFSSTLIYLSLKKIFLEEKFEKLIEKGLVFLNKFNNLGLENVRFPDSYSAKRIININEFVQDEVFGAYLDILKEDEAVKEVIDELEGFGINPKPVEVFKIVADLSEEYKRNFNEALDYVESISLEREKIHKLIKLRSIPYYKVEFSFKNYLPHSRQQILNDLEIELRNNLESLRGALSRLGIKNPEQKVDEILTDSEVFGTIKGTIDKFHQLQMVDVEKVKSNLEILQNMEQNAGQSNNGNMNQDEELEEEELGDEELEEDLDEGNLPSDGMEEQQITDRVLDSKGGRGRRKVQENPTKIEIHTGQSSESVVDKRKYKSQN